MERKKLTKQEMDYFIDYIEKDKGMIDSVDYERVTETTAIYKDSVDNLLFNLDNEEMGDLLKMCYLGFGLGEVGEIQGKIKKIIRDKGGVMDEADKVALLKECGDELYYLTQVIIFLGSRLEEVMTANAAKLLSRLQRGTIKGSGDNR